MAENTSSVSIEKQVEYTARDAITDGIIDFLKPSIEEIDDRVEINNQYLVFYSPKKADVSQRVRSSRHHLNADISGLDKVKKVMKLESQFELRQHIDSLSQDLQVISENQTIAVDLESYVKKLNNSRRRVMLVNNILQNIQERLTKLYNSVSKETARKKSQLDPHSPVHTR